METKYPAKETKYPAKETKLIKSMPRCTPPLVVPVHKYIILRCMSTYMHSSQTLQKHRLWAIATLPLFPPTHLCICRWLQQPCVSAGGSNSPVYLQVAPTAQCICRWLKQPCLKLWSLNPCNAWFSVHGPISLHASFNESFVAWAFKHLFICFLVQKLLCTSSTLSGPHGP